MNRSTREMDTKYWDGMARGYEKEIFSVLHIDERGLIRETLRRIASKKDTVADIGCGIGHFLPLLSELFGRVYANDISRGLLERAKDDHGKLSNISFLHGDIRTVFKKFPKVDCAVSVNSLISSSVAIRHRMLSAIAAILKSRGHFVLVVPSLESSFFVDVRFAQWKWKDGMDRSRAVRSVYPGDPSADHKARQGVLAIDGVATKHYLREELQLLLVEAGFKVLEIRKVEYSWDTELDKPPRWMREPYPWDWFVVAQRTGRKQCF